MQRLALELRRARVPIGFVPTMGCLHEGHLSLVQLARRKVGRTGRVVVSIYVNPTQFSPAEDLARYPRDLARDLRHCRGAGVDIVFAPTDGEMYPGRERTGFSTYIQEEKLGRWMEGIARPTHFRGVTTVVGKLFNIVQPRVAVFGEKDFQQAAIIRRMVCDLNFPVNIAVGPTAREPDGLAMSSRNRYLSPSERSAATILSRALAHARSVVAGSHSRTWKANALKREVTRFIRREPQARIDYLEIFDPNTLEPVRQISPGARLALAVFIGNTRLIDNGAVA